MDRPDPTVRLASDDDTEALVAVAIRSLGWKPSDPNVSFFRWKHQQNPAGRSPIWLAETGGELMGFRTMMRWRFRRNGQPVDAVRAVDTATDPDHLRRGVFRLLTMTAVEALTADQINFVFNTPNAKSRPGYLRMGWDDAGRLPVRVAVAGPRSIPRLMRSRTAACKWSTPLNAGRDIASVSADLAALPPTAAPAAFTTSRDRPYLDWRYGFEPLGYRVIQTDNAAAVVRLRTRGKAAELVVADVFANSSRSSRQPFRQLRRLRGVDHVLTLASAAHPQPPLLPVPKLGPHLTVRSLSQPAPAAAQFRFSLGDIELF